MLQHKAALVVDSGLLRWFVGVLSGLASISFLKES